MLIYSGGESLDLAGHSRDSMSPNSEQDETTPTTTSYTKTNRFAQGRKRQMTSLVRRTNEPSKTTPTTSTSIPTPTTSTVSAPLVPRNVSCPQCLIPDNDPFVHYGGVWLLNVGPQSSTSHSTTTAGSSVSMKFNGKLL